MDPTLFHDAKLKIKRANQHIQELQARIDAFLKSDFYCLLIQHNAHVGDKTLKFEMTKPVPEDIPLMIGDALHNLRTVLDYMAFEIVTRAGGTADYVKFPVRDDRENLKGALTGGEMKVAGSDIIDLILDVVQPYRGGNGAALCVLHSLDLTDKHYHAIPIISVTGLTRVNMKVGGMTFTNCSFVNRDSTELNVLRVPANVTFEGHAEPMFSILFGRGDVFEGESIIPMLQQLSQLIAGTLQAVAQVYLAREQAAAHSAPAPEPPPAPPEAGAGLN